MFAYLCVTLGLFLIGALINVIGLAKSTTAKARMADGIAMMIHLPLAFWAIALLAR